EGTDLVALQRRLAVHAEQAVRSAVREAVRDAVRASSLPGPAAGAPLAPAERPAAPPSALEQTGLTTWPAGLPDGRLPDVLRSTSGGQTVLGHPTLVVETPRRDAPSPVALRVLADAAPERHARAVRELLLGELALPTGRVTSRWTAQESLTLAASPYPSTAALVVDLQRAALDALVAEGVPGPVLDEATYRALRTGLRDTLEDRTAVIAADVVAVLGAARELDAALRTSDSLALIGARADVRDQLDRLVGDGFVVTAGAARLPHLVRYLRAAQHRLAKAAESPHRDAALAAQVREAAEALASAVALARTSAPDPARDARLTEARWLVEELRVSLFAQHLRTAVPVSVKRIRTVLAG
ncbi:MAG TPA: DUF3418 domain-containing protein, partial [Actinotalea sp.]|nr:DUF3418 domain-containing protein [Actinotalea sp.]